MRLARIAALAGCLAVTSCDGGGATVEVNQDQGQDQGQDAGNPGFDAVPTPFDDGCDVTCNRRFDGFIQVIRICQDGTQTIQLLTSLPPHCDSVNDITPITGSTTGGGVSGQATGG